jgi:hypothetical protein
MNAPSDATIISYVEAAAQLAQMPLAAERVPVVAAVMARIAGFAADLRAFELPDDVEIAGIFTP